ncbi:MAG: hypothetical protein JXA89_24125 [Anaerolineae bacterium]|nr:hypothetical protein [Anaerolineae bacterium]
MFWLLSADLEREKLALLVLCMIVGYVLSTNLVWRLFYLSKSGVSGERSTRWSWIGIWVKQVGRLLYYVGVPCIVFARGALLYQAGIPMTWVARSNSVPWYQLVANEMLNLESIGMAAAVWIGGVCLFSAVWIWYARVGAGGVKRQSIALWQAFREALFFQMLWAFYRGVISMILSNPAIVAFVVVALVSVSWLLSPLRRKSSGDLACGYQTVRDWILALLTACAAPGIRLLWLLVLMHWLWLWTSDRILNSVAASPHRKKATLSGA